jgi:hypothetical protein
MRDLKKEGLTKPRFILKIILDELHLRWPKLKAFEYPEFFDSFKIPGVDAVRGHGQGMANALTTIMQIALV